MQYEEYEKRMRAQKRQPVPREAYRSCVERGYMAVEVDKDEFCKLPDWAMQALCDLDVARDVTIEERDEARKSAATWRKAAEDLEARVKELEEENRKGDSVILDLDADINRRDALIKKLSEKLGVEALAKMLLEGED